MTYWTRFIHNLRSNSYLYKEVRASHPSSNEKKAILVNTICLIKTLSKIEFYSL